MNSKPHLTTYRGAVIKVLSRNLEGAIFVLSLSRNRTIKVVVHYRLLPQAPQPGDAWSVSGVIERSDSHGRQLQATTAKLEKPTGEEIVKFLGLSPFFPEVSLRSAWTAFRRYGNKLQYAIDTCDYLMVAKIFKLHIGIAVDLCSRWHDFWEQSRMRSLLVSASLQPSLASFLYACWGVEAANRLQANPYCLLPWLPWAVVDRAALAYFRLRESAVERLVGAVKLSLHDCARTGDTAVSRSRLNARLIRRLGSPKLAALALREAINSGATVAFSSEGTTPVYQSKGLFRVETNLLSRIQDHEVSDRYPESAVARRMAPAMRPVRSMTLVFAEGLTLNTILGQLAARDANSFHLLPLHQEALSALSTSTETHLRSLSSLLNGSLTINQATTIYVYGIEGFNLLTFSKIVHRVPATTSLRLVVRSRFQQAIGPGPVLQWLLAQEWVERTQLKPQPIRDEQGVAEFRHALDSNLPAKDFKRELEKIFVSTSGYRETVETTLSEFYAALDAGSSSILVTSSTEAHQLNSILHEDVILVAKESKKDHPTVKLGGSDNATHGEPVICVRDIPELGLVAGSVGKISNIETGYAYEIRLGQPVRIAANAVFEFTGAVTLSLANLSKLGLAYALPANRCQFRYSENVVVMLTNYPSLNRRWIHKAACCASRTLKIIGEPAYLKNCLDDPGGRTNSVWGALGTVASATTRGAQ